MRRRVAVDTRHGRVVGTVEVTVRADRAMVRDLPVLRVIKGGPEPTGGGVAPGHRARRREARRNMIRHRTAKRLRALPGSDVATVAVGRQIPGIVVIYVAR